jgi:protocatechuate 3,4-dioxygenase beta subunit
MRDHTRRKVLIQIASVGGVALTGGTASAAAVCQRTISDIEGPFYIPSAPLRNNLALYGDKGTPLLMEGRVFNASCTEVVGGAAIEFWQANPMGVYDNNSSEMRYRCKLTTDPKGRYSLRTLLPGLYLNGSSYRPRHIHMKIYDPFGKERLTTQLYFRGDPHLKGDPFGHPSLVMDFSETNKEGMVASSVDFYI